MRSPNAVLANLGSLLLAAVLALFIWLTATQEQDPRTGQFLQVGVDFVGQPADSLLIEPQRLSVQVRVEGPESVLREISPDDFEAFVDLSNIPFGEQVMAPIQIKSDAEDVDLTLTIPEEIEVVLEEQVSRDIPVELDIRGAVARGHRQGEPLIEPAYIRVSGPQSDVENLDFALVTVFLSSPRETTVGIHRPVFYDSQGRVASTVDLEADTQDVQVTVPVEQSAGFAEKLITVDWSGDPAYGHRLLNISVEPPSVLVEGAPEVVNSITRLMTEPIDITGLTESFVQQTTLALPEGISLDQNQEFFVSIEIEPILSTDTRLRDIEVLGLDDKLEATLTPDQVGVVLFGPLPVLDSLINEDVRVTVDLFELEPGRHSIEPQIDLPDRGIEVRSVQPSAISVFITKTLTTTNELSGTLPLTATIPLTGSETTLMPESNAIIKTSQFWADSDSSVTVSAKTAAIDYSLPIQKLGSLPRAAWTRELAALTARWLHPAVVNLPDIYIVIPG
ncbi:MAG: YbbR-like domain-containing protein [Candidatus Promineifilaceae bacterium]